MYKLLITFREFCCFCIVFKKRNEALNSERNNTVMMMVLLGSGNFFLLDALNLRFVRVKWQSQLLGWAKKWINLATYREYINLRYNLIPEGACVHLAFKPNQNLLVRKMIGMCSTLQLSNQRSSLCQIKEKPNPCRFLLFKEEKLQEQHAR